MNESYWLAWIFDNGKFYLVDWANSELAEAASKVFWPSITMEQAKDSVLLECYETQHRIERNIEHQELPNLDLAKLPFRNTFIVAEPKQNADYGKFVECTYWIECLPVDKE